jgi:hypothetical protein
MKSVKFIQKFLNNSNIYENWYITILKKYVENLNDPNSIYGITKKILIRGLNF